LALDACFLLVAIVPGARDLRDVWNDPAVPPATRRALTRELGSLARALGDAGLYQPDFAPNNFLVRPGPAPTILPIDFERARWVAAPSAAKRIGALAKLERHAGQATRAERLRLVTAYAGSREAARRAWREIEGGTITLLERDRSRLLRRATRESRRFRCLERDGWSGWALRDAEFDSSWEGDTAAACLKSGSPYAAIGPWLVCREPGRNRSGAEIWALSQALAIRGLGPRAVAWLERGDERRLIFARSDARAVREADLPLLSVLYGRLRALGTLANVHPKGIVISQAGSRPATRRALLLDIAAFRPGSNPRMGKI
jgi:hypothetical protein